MTLIIALVMLVIIGLTSAAVMRNALGSDVVANNTRVKTLAQQAAQIGLRYCEAQLSVPAVTRVVTLYAAAATEDAQRWRSFANWFGGSVIATTVPSSLMATSSSTFTPAVLPQCMVERSTLPSTFIVTSRGFSPDFERDSAGRTTAGSVVWLQAVVTATPPP